MARFTMKPLPLFSWLYDAIPDDRGIKFVRFGMFTTHAIPYQHIEEVVEMGRWKRAPLMSLDFQNRLFCQAFLIKAKSGFLWKNVLITPKDSSAFRRQLAMSGVAVNKE